MEIYDVGIKLNFSWHYSRQQTKIHILEHLRWLRDSQSSPNDWLLPTHLRECLRYFIFLAILMNINDAIFFNWRYSFFTIWHDLHLPVLSTTNYRCTFFLCSRRISQNEEVRKQNSRIILILPLQKRIARKLGWRRGGGRLRHGGVRKGNTRNSVD